MSYADFELSVAAAAPVELYHFARGGTCWLYTSADRDIVFQGQTYLARTISRGAISRSDEASASDLSIRMDRALKVAQEFIVSDDGRPMHFRLYRFHRADAEWVVPFRGIVANHQVLLEEIELTVQAPLGKDEVEVPRETIMRTCPHSLYGRQCRVDRSSFAHSTTVRSIRSDTRIVELVSDGGQPSGWYDAGLLVDTVTGAQQFILRHFLNDVTLLAPLQVLVPGRAVTVYAGCDKVVETCRDKFDNVPNFGGFPRHPERNPFYQIPGEND